MFQNLNFKNFRIIAAFAAIILFALSLYFLFLPVYVINEEFIIAEGDGLSRIAEKLKNENLIKNEYFFIFYVRALGLEKELKAGNYIFNGFMSVPKIISLLAEGFAEGDDIRAVIPEGSNIWEVDLILTDAGISKEGDFAGQFYRDEGYLFPDTYRFKKDKPADNLAGRPALAFKQAGIKMKDNFKKQTKDILAGLSEDRKNEIVIKASILEKEAKTENDMRLIAGIIAKRFELGMPLQIDAAVSYGACLREFKSLKPVPLQTEGFASGFKSLSCDVSRIGVANEIRIDSEFNTYMRKGLPPHPISNPGLKALSAAVSPLKSDYLYYLSTRSGDKIIYSRTAEEHAENRKKYLGI